MLMFHMRTPSSNAKALVPCSNHPLRRICPRQGALGRRCIGRHAETVTPVTRLSMAASLTSSARISISDRMKELKTMQKTAFLPFVCAGDPDLETTAEALRCLDEISTVIELGVPYSDPLADGPVIHGAATRALEQSTTLDKVLDMLSKVTPELTCPILLFTYFNPILARGLDVFCRQIREAGVSGLVVPDLPLELTHDIREACGKEGIELTLLVTPTTPKERMREIAKCTQGFVYLISVTGVTGMRTELNQKLQNLIEMLHDTTEESVTTSDDGYAIHTGFVGVSVGFGVSTGEHAKQLREWGADGVVVGSALVKALHEGGLSKMKAVAQSIQSGIA